MNLRNGNVVIIGHWWQPAKSAEVIAGTTGSIRVVPGRILQIGWPRENDQSVRHFGRRCENLICRDNTLRQRRRTAAVKVKDAPFLTLPEDNEQPGFGSLLKHDHTRDRIREFISLSFGNLIF